MTRNDRGMRGRPAALRDYCHVVRGVQASGVGRGEVVGKQHDGDVRVGYARFRLVQNACNDAVPHVPQVRGPLSEAPAGLLEQRDEPFGCDGCSLRGGSPLFDALFDLGHPPGIAHQTCGHPQDFSSVPRGSLSTCLQTLRDVRGCLTELDECGRAVLLGQTL